MLVGCNRFLWATEKDDGSAVLKAYFCRENSSSGFCGLFTNIGLSKECRKGKYKALGLQGVGDVFE